SGSGGLAALADHPATLPLGRPTPHAVVLAVGQRPLKARLTDRAVCTHGLRLSRVLLGHGIEDGGIKAPARTLLAPGQVHRDHFLVAAFTPFDQRPPRRSRTGGLGFWNLRV